MPLWLTENIGTILVCAAMVGVVIVIMLSMIRNKKKGNSSCGCGCQGCAMKGSCHLKK